MFSLNYIIYIYIFFLKLNINYIIIIKMNYYYCYNNYFYYYNLMIYNQKLNYINNYNKNYIQNKNKKKYKYKYVNKMNIPIIKLNKYYDHTKNNKNDNPPSVNILLNHLWPEYYNNKKNEKKSLSNIIKKQLSFEEQNKEWIKFYNNK